MSARLFPTRGQVALPSNTTPKMLAARTKRSLAGIRKSVETLAEPWIDVDPMVRFSLDALISAFDEFERQINESVSYLNESAP